MKTDGNEVWKTIPDRSAERKRHLTGQELVSSMTLRQHFAAMAMQGIISSNDFKTYGYSDLERAASAVRCADALIAVLKEEKKG